LDAPIHDLIEAHVRSVTRTIAEGRFASDREVDPAALRCVLKRQAAIFDRMGYQPGELTLLPEGSHWWCVEVVPVSVLSWKPASPRRKL
jgi:hypothetical protein